MLIKIITKTLKKVLCGDDNNTKQIYKKCCTGKNIGIILTRTGLHRLSLNFVSAEFFVTLEMASICSTSAHFQYISVKFTSTNHHARYIYPEIRNGYLPDCLHGTQYSNRQVPKSS